MWALKSKTMFHEFKLHLLHYRILLTETEVPVSIIHLLFVSVNLCVYMRIVQMKPIWKLFWTGK